MKLLRNPPSRGVKWKWLALSSSQQFSENMKATVRIIYGQKENKYNRKQTNLQSTSGYWMQNSRAPQE